MPPTAAALPVGLAASNRYDGQVVGGDVALLAAPRLHQAPLRVPSLVVRLQDTDRFAGTHGNFVVPSRLKVIGSQHLEKRTRGHCRRN